MPRADEVKPGRWESITVLLDNGWYSIIFGIFDGDECLGERWNGNGKDRGFPSTHGHPQWHVVPEFLQSAVLQAALDEIKRSPYKGSKIHKNFIIEKLMKILSED